MIINLSPLNAQISLFSLPLSLSLSLKKQTQVVTPQNISSLRQMVINGPLKYPGATHIEEESGRITSLHSLSKARRESLAKKLSSMSGSQLANGTSGKPLVLFVHAHT